MRWERDIVLAAKSSRNWWKHFSLFTLQAGATPASKFTATRPASFNAYVNPLYTENLSQITFRLLELGAILWFPCILWNCNNPEKLWALNPKKLLLPDAQMGHINETEVTLRDRSQDNVSKNDCWICYDPSHDSDLINPCKCKVKYFEGGWYRGYHIRRYHLVVGWHTLECNIWFCVWPH